MTECCIKCWLVGAATAIVLMLAAVDARADGTPTSYEQVSMPAAGRLLGGALLSVVAIGIANRKRRKA